MRHASVGVILACFLFAAGCTRQGQNPPAAEEGAQRIDLGEIDPKRNTAPRLYKRVVAVCVGAGTFKSGKIPSVEACETGARQIADLFKAEFGYEPVSLIGKAATRAEVVSTLDRLRTELTDDDALIVYLAGHGKVVPVPPFGQAGYFIPHDAAVDLKDESDPKRWAAEGIDLRELSKRLSTSRARHVVLIVDSCFSGFVARYDGRAADGQNPPSRSRTAITATTKDELATPDTNTGLCRFTGTLLSKLRARLAPIPLGTLFDEVAGEVRRNSNGAMTPERGTFGPGAGEFVFVPLAVRTEDANRFVAAAPAKPEQTPRATVDDILSAFDAPDYRFGPKRQELERLWRARFERYAENAARGDEMARLAQSVCYVKGLGTDPDPKEAYRLLRLSLNAGLPEAKPLLAYYLHDGYGVPPNDDAGFEVLLEAAKDAPGFAAVVMADYAFHLQATGPDERPLVLQKCEEAIRLGVKIGYSRLAMLKIKFESPLPDPEFKRLRTGLTEVAEGGNAQAQYLLSNLLTRGRNAPTASDKKEALAWLTRAADQGHAPSQGDLAAEYYRSCYHVLKLDLKKDMSEVYRWTGYARDQKQPIAWKIVAMAFLFGDAGETTNDERRKKYDDAVKHDPTDKRWRKWYNDELFRRHGIRYE